ncbi:RIP metalloprotease RseP [Pokkaliibacter sp. CJK22405]|uniref:RIP metalloprotease RseP n=1 Tax=Pokkaliibacter sp. CJK22405 TaxID=3384615 RepID=UPI0039852449
MVNLIALIVTLGILVTIHEFGHFYVARLCGVKVLRFSVGFGKPFFTWHDKHGTEFCLAAIPLGGYVRMLDEREGEVQDYELEQAFNRKPVLQRFAIVAAGPLINILFAVVAYWGLFVWGVQGIAPVIGQISAQSPAAMADVPPGGEVVQVDGHPVHNWEDVNTRLASAIGRTGNIDLAVKSDGATHQYALPVKRWQSDKGEPDLIGGLGLQPWQPAWNPVIGKIVAGGAAERAGMKSGDNVLTVDGKAVSSWSQWVEVIRANPEKALEVAVENEGQQRVLTMTPDRHDDGQGGVIGYIGAGAKAPSWPADMVREIQYGPIDALQHAVDKTASMVRLMVDSVGKLLSGLMSVESLGGPITIAKVAGTSASLGVESFVSFLAYLSISLGVLNLLPVPMLDGGHLVFFLVEMVKGKPVSESLQMMSLRIGMVLLGGLMILALYNDLMRL